jgi:glutaredoxin
MYIVYGLTNCEYCKLAIEELRIRGCSFYYFSMDEQSISENSPSLEQIKDKYDWPTVPIIIDASTYGEKLIGGYVDLIECFEDSCKVK